MSAEDFPQALRLVLVDEGGLDDDPHDHGGRTAYGIIQREYDGYRARHNLPHQDVWKITPAEYTEIYRDRYWQPWCDRLPPGIDYAFFDGCVNAGPASAAKQLQRALGLRMDGHMGDVTLGKVSEMCQTERGTEELIHAFCEARRSFYRSLRQFPRYGRGWLARTDHVERAAKQFAIDAEGTQRYGLSDELKMQATARAKAEDVNQPPVSTGAAVTATTVTGLGSGIADQISSATSQLSPFQDTVHIVKYILVGLAIVSLCLMAYSVWHANKMKQVAAA